MTDTTKERAQQFEIKKQGELSYTVLLDGEHIEEFTDEPSAIEYARWFSGKLDAAYEAGWLARAEQSTKDPPIWERINECVLEIDTYCFAERLMKAGERQMHIRSILQKYFDVVAEAPRPVGTPPDELSRMCACGHASGQHSCGLDLRCLFHGCNCVNFHDGPVGTPEEKKP